MESVTLATAAFFVWTLNCTDFDFGARPLPTTSPPPVASPQSHSQITVFGTQKKYSLSCTLPPPNLLRAPLEHVFFLLCLHLPCNLGYMRVRRPRLLHARHAAGPYSCLLCADGGGVADVDLGDRPGCRFGSSPKLKRYLCEKLSK